MTIKSAEIFLRLYFLVKRFLRLHWVMYKQCMLNPKAFTELNELYKKHYGIELSDEELRNEAIDLLYLYAVSQGSKMDFRHFSALHSLSEE